MFVNDISKMTMTFFSLLISSGTNFFPILYWIKLISIVSQIEEEIFLNEVTGKILSFCSSIVI